MPALLARPGNGLVGSAATRLIRTKLINHVTIVLDASGSMGRHAAAVRSQLKALIEDLAATSRELDQETRVTVYSFSTTVRVLVFDTDVLRLPSVDEMYEVLNERTALYDATAVSLDDLATTSTIYGDHAFLVYLITDGLENASRLGGYEVSRRIDALGENWTVGALVPDPRGRREVEALGVPTDNVILWDVHSDRGFVDAGAAVRSATRSYMENRASGVRSTRSLFSTGADAVNAQTVGAAVASGDLQPLAPDTYVVVPVDERSRIDDFVRKMGFTFKVGQGFYGSANLNKRVEIQPQKLIAVREKSTGRVFTDMTVTPEGVGSPRVRALIGLPNVTTKVRPDMNPDFEMFFQSTAVNRVLEIGWKLLYLK